MVSNFVGRVRALVLGACTLVAGSIGAMAQDAWPSRAVTIILPYAAGGGADPVVRLLADRLSKKLNQTFLVDFRPGASGTIGTALAARAEPDGYTLVFVPTPPVIQMKIMRTDLPYDPRTDLVPIIKISDSPSAIMASGKFGPKTLKEYIEYAKANPGNLKVGVPGLGGGGHIATAMIEQVSGVSLNLVPYGGTGELLPHLISGVLNGAHDFPAAYVGHLASGNVRIIAVMSDKRVPALPDVPTAAEQGYPDMKLLTWYGMFAPKGTPAAIVGKANAAINEVLKEPEVIAKFESLGYTVTGSTVDEFAKIYASDFVTLEKIIKSAGIKLP